MFRSAGGRNDTAEAGWLQHARDLTHRLPKEFNVLESLAGNDYVDAGRGDFAPVVRILQNEIDIFANGEINSFVMPSRFSEKRPVGAVNVVAA